MEPIISPLWFYLIGVVPGIKDGILFISCVVFLSFLVLNIKHHLELIKLNFKYKFIITLSVIGIMFSALLPSKDTLYCMAVAANVTPNNIEAVGNSAEDIVDYIIDVVDQLNDGDDRNK